MGAHLPSHAARHRRHRLEDRPPRPRGHRRLTALLAGLAGGLALLLPSLAAADTSSSLTVVGTSDVSDSGLMTDLIQPQFEKAYPQYTFKYKGTATGAAIASAESGADGASVLIVHAPSLENRFVAGGYSYERYGRALFTNDFVLAGPKGDPAAVAANGAHDVARALADVAAAGIAGKATFISRGGTPGTTVEEHRIWSQVLSAQLAPAGLWLCALNGTLGGGDTPIVANRVGNSGDPCPNGGALPTSSQLPAWYVTTGLTQGPNVVNANACSGYPSGQDSCYVLTDRGTYDYLASGTDPAGSIPALTIVTRDDSSDAPGGQFGLVNYFHGYVINPSKPDETVNVHAAQAFLDFLTSQTFQAQLSTYLAHTTDPGGAPFRADASPLITVPAAGAPGGLPRTFVAGRPLTVTGTVANAEPGYPAPSAQTVSIDEVSGTTPLAVATARLAGGGAFRIRFSPTASGAYEVSTAQIVQIEDSTLSPVFGDVLSPAATAATHVTVDARVTNIRVRSESGRVIVLGSVAPGTGHVHGTVSVYARRNAGGAFKRKRVEHLSDGDGNFAIAPSLARGRWQVEVKFADRGVLVGSTSKRVRLRVGAKPDLGVSVRSVDTVTGRVRVHGALTPRAGSGITTVELLGLRTTNGRPARFKLLAKMTVPNGRVHFTVRAKLRRGTRWVLQLARLHRHGATDYSGLRTVRVS